MTGLLLVALLACQRSSEPIRAALVPNPTAESQVRLFRSVDRGASWTLDPTPVAYGVTSLHACTFEQTVWVPCLLQVHEIPWIDTTFPVPFIDVLRSEDLVHWTADRIPVRAKTTGGVDPACVVGPDGLEMWFAEVSGTSGDPAKGSRPSSIWRTRWDGARLGAGEVVHVGNGLVDPAPLYVDGTLRLFLNQRGERIVEVVGNALVSTWEGVTVPHAVDLGSSRWLVAQEQRNGGSMPVAVDLSAPRKAASFPIPIDGALHTCESPSMTTLGDTWLLFCVDVAHRGPRP